MISDLNGSNRHSYSSRYQRTIFIQLIYSVVFHVTRHQPIAQLHLSVYTPHRTQDSQIRSDERLPLETSASESLYGDQFTSSTHLIKPNYRVILPPTQHHSFFKNLPPLQVFRAGRRQLYAKFFLTDKILWCCPKFVK